MKFYRVRNLFACSYFLILYTSCATILSGSREKVVFSTHPRDASIIFDGAEQGKTPDKIKVKRSRHDKEVIMRNEGCDDLKIVLHPVFNLYSFLDIFFPPGFIIDYATGALFRYKNPEQHFIMMPDKFSDQRLSAIKLRAVRSFDDIAATNNQIEWQDSIKLTITDFQDSVVLFSDVVALTYSNLVCYYFKTDSSLEFYVASRFSKDCSWFKSPYKKDEEDIYKKFRFQSKEKVAADVLNHEQRHFDIAEWYSRLLKFRIKNHAFSNAKYESELIDLFLQTRRELNERQSEYDDACSNMSSSFLQNSWNKRIDNELRISESEKNAGFRVLLPQE